jgi:hypothetical protein
MTRKNQFDWTDDGMCQWMDSSERCGRYAVKVVEDSKLAYCEKHYDAVFFLRDWIFLWIRSKPMRKLANKIALITSMFLLVFFAGCSTPKKAGLRLGVTPAGVTLTWTQSVTPGITGNNVYRGPTSGSETLLTTTPLAPTTTYEDPSVAQGSSYCYEITALDSAASPPESAKSNEMCVTISVAPQTPAAPTGLGGTVTAQSVIGTTAPCVVSPYNVWTNVTFPAQTGNFEIQFDATPSASKADAVMGLSAGAASSDNNLAVSVLFSNTGFIQMMNGAFPYPASSIPYVGGQKYHFTLDVNLAAKTYTGYVGTTTRTVLALNYAFRSLAGTPASLGYIGLLQDQASATNSICNTTLLTYPA